MINNKKLIYTGKAKQIYQYDNDRVIIEYSDNVTAFNSQKKAIMKNKGKINNEISIIIFNYLNENGINTHFLKKISETEQLCLWTKIIPLEVIVRNIAMGSIVKKLGIQKGISFQKPIVEFSLKNDDLNDPLISERQIIGIGILNEDQLQIIINEALKINHLLQTLVNKLGITLVDFKIEFGTHKSKILLADEISPDSMRLLDNKTKKSLDKDLYRDNTGNLIEGYSEFLERLSHVIKTH